MSPTTRSPRLRLATAMPAAILAASVPGLFLAPQLGAESFCVGTSAELQGALALAGANGQTDTIKVVQGVYATSGQEFSYFTTEDFDLILLGGYTAGCAGRELDPRNTVLDGENATRVMRLVPDNDTAGALAVQGFTFRNGMSPSGNGGGLSISGIEGHSGDVTVDRNIIIDNHSGDFGGGLTGGSDTGTTRITNNLIAGNSAAVGHGGANPFADGTAYITNNTVAGNTAPQVGGFILLGTAPAARTVSNNVFYGNTGTDLYLNVAGVLLDHNDIGSLFGTPAPGSTGNLSVDPGFVGGGDYDLLSDSPVVDAGTNTPAGGLTATDLEGRDRIYNGIVDLGAYEYSGGPDAVELARFAAEPRPGAVLLTWRTAFESEHVGFHVRRARAGDPSGAEGAVELTAAPIEPPGPHAYLDTRAEPGIAYLYWLDALDRSGRRERFGPVAATAGSPASAGRGRTSLAVNRPNPWPASVPRAEIRFDLAAPAHASLRVFDAGGRLVRRLAGGPLGAGPQRVFWDGTADEGGKVGPGVYFLRLDTGEAVVTQRLVRIR